MSRQKKWGVNIAMIKMILLVKRNPKLTREEFQKYWRENHGPLVASFTECSRYMRKYVQNHITTDPTLAAIAAGVMGHSKPDPAADFDGIVEAWYDSIEDLQRSGANEKFMEVIREDEKRFGDHSKSVCLIVSENVVFDEEHRPAGEKAM
jgi:uncharacterized protein (TIGR02118 family)